MCLFTVVAQASVLYSFNDERLEQCDTDPEATARKYITSLQTIFTSIFHETLTRITVSVLCLSTFHNSDCKAK